MKLNKFLRYGIFAGLALVPFIPLVVTSSMFFPFITGKNFMFRILVVAMVALWLILMVRDPEARPKNSLILWGIVALLVVTSVATVFSVNPYRSFWSNFERMDGLITQIHLFLYFIVVTGVLTTRRYWYQFFNINLLAAACVSVYAISQLLGTADIHQGSTRIDATLGNAAYMAVYMLINLFVAAYLAVVATKNNWLRFVYGFLSILFTVLLYLTQTRGTILGLVGGLFLLGLILTWRGQGRLKKVSIGLSVGLVILAGMFFAFKDTNFVRSNQTLNRFASISLTEKTTTSRFTIWGMSLKAVAERPVLGWGPESYPYVFSKYYEPVLWSQEPWFDRSHNVFLDWLVTAGVLGLAAYLFLFGAAIYYLFRLGLLRKKGSTETYNQIEVVGAGLLVAMLAAYLCHNFFVFDNLISYILFFSLLGFIHTLATEHQKSFYHDLAVPEWGMYAVGTLAVIFFAGMFYFTDVKPIMASRSLIRAIASTDSQTKVSEFERVFSLNTFGSKEALEQYLSSGINSILADTKISVALNKSAGELALSQISKQAKEAGPDARPYIIFGTFMSNIGRLDEAANYFKQAAIYSPKKQVVYFQLAAVYVSQNNFSKALEAAKTAYDLDPSYPEANLMYALVAIYSGDTALADQLLTKNNDGLSIINDDRLISAYTFAKRPDKIEQILRWRVDGFEKKIKANPEDQNSYISLADTWEKLGRKELANEALLRLTKVLAGQIKNDPDNINLYLSLAKIYFRLGDNEKVSETITASIARYEDKIKREPRNTDNYVIIADIYLQAGRADLAKQMIERAVSVNPGFRYQAAEWLKKIPATAPQP